MSGLPPEAAASSWRRAGAVVEKASVPSAIAAASRAAFAALPPWTVVGWAPGTDGEHQEQHREPEHC